MRGLEFFIINDQNIKYIILKLLVWGQENKVSFFQEYYLVQKLLQRDFRGRSLVCLFRKREVLVEIYSIEILKEGIDEEQLGYMRKGIELGENKFQLEKFVFVWF